MESNDCFCWKTREQLSNHIIRLKEKNVMLFVETKLCSLKRLLSIILHPLKIVDTQRTGIANIHDQWQKEV